MTDSFGRRLRAERERKRVALQAIAQSTKINLSLLEALERDDLSRWPSGIFRRAFIRSYAQAIGLDPERIVREFLERFPDPGDAQTAVVKEDRRRTARHDSSPAAPSPLRLTLADEPSPFARSCGRILIGSLRRLTAASCDLASVTAMAGAAFALDGRFWTPLTIVTACYYFGGVIALGNSPGAWLVARMRKTVAGDAPFTRTQPAQAPGRLDETRNLRQFKPRPVVPPEPERMGTPINTAAPSLENTDTRHASV